MKAAQKLAAAIGGEVRIPGADDHTPESAVVVAEIEGHHVEIDFLTHVLGISDDERLRKAAIDLIFQVRVGGTVQNLRVPIMHPLHCLFSRIANIITLGRRDDTARRQLEAAPVVVREFIAELLGQGKAKAATATLGVLYEYLRYNIEGKKAYRIMRNDPAKILDYFAEDVRLDPRYREKTLDRMRQALAERRTAFGFLKSIVGAGPQIEGV